MPDLPLGVIRTAVSGIKGDSPFTNVLWVLDSDPSVPTGTEMNTWAGAFLAAYEDAFSPLFDSTTATSGCVSDYAVGDGTFVRGNASSSAPGTRDGDFLPAQVACCVSLRTAADSYRGGHGRCYLPAGTQHDLGSARFWDPSFTDSVQSAASDFVVALGTLDSPTGAGTSPLCIVRKISGGVPLDPPVPHLVTSVGVDRRVDTQRRRLGPDII